MRVDQVVDEIDQDQIIAETTVTTRSERYATQFREVNDELFALVTASTDEEWRRTCAEEGWPVGVVAHHVAISLPAFGSMVQTLANAGRMPRLTIDTINAGNAQHAEEFASVSQDEVLDLLRVHGPKVEAVLRGLTEEQLAHTTSAFMNREWSLSQIIEMIVIGHSRIHLASLRATIAE